MPIQYTRTVTTTVAKIVIKWERDIDASLQWLDEQMVFIGGNNNNLDVHETYLNIIRVGGCTPEQSRKQTAGQIARVNAWLKDQWTHLGCIATAVSDEGEEITSASLWGIESFSNEYAKEVEGEEIAELKHTLINMGYSVTDEEWDALPREEENEYSPTDSDPAANVAPLPELPADDEFFTYRYGSKVDANGDYPVPDAEGTIVAVCRSCGEPFALDTKDKPNAHHTWCTFAERNR